MNGNISCHLKLEFVFLPEIKMNLITVVNLSLFSSWFQLECFACGHVWYASRDEVSTLTVDGPSRAASVGAAPLATSKFENVEKLLSPRDSANDVLKKSSEAYIPVLETQRSFKSKNEDNSEPAKKAE